MIVEHQLISSKIFVPDWPIKTLILGTFNPEGNKKVDYFYGRRRNRFWPAIYECFGIDFNKTNKLNQKFRIMEENQFGCMDIIRSVEINDQEFLPKITGDGYSDSNLFSGVRDRKLIREYNWEAIKQIAKKNKVETILHTWGNRCSPLEFRKKIIEFREWCLDNDIKFVVDCPSPSAHGGQSIKELARFYKKHLII